MPEDPKATRRILTITLNPAVDLTTGVAELVAGRKLRCEIPRFDPGGGGVNVSRMLKELGGASTALAAVGGATGALMRELLVAAGIETVFLESAGLTRQSFAVHDHASGAQYRFVLPGPVQDAAFAGQALSAIEQLLATGEFPYVVASGSLPPGVPEGFYGEVAALARTHGCRAILDTSGPCLRAALGRDLFLLRTNQIEARQLARMMDVDPDDQNGLAQALVASGAAEAVIIALGADGMLLAQTDGVLQIRPPPVDIASPVGAGDSFVGALCFALGAEWPLERACAYGVAAAAAALMTEATELAHKADVERLFAVIEGCVERL